ncbi:MAG: carboxylesterase family protein [Bacilli bacterium]|nr:carboxylesterase family protein [Bacilli bacterium]
MKNKKHLFFWIVFPIGWTLITLLLIFIYDLTNGPLALFIIQLVALAAFAAIRILFINKKLWMRLLTWAGMISVSIALLAFSQPSYQRKSAAYYDNPDKINEVLQLNEGKVHGIYNVDKTVRIYAGIPYAKAERWKEPTAYTWDDVIDGSYFGARSMQPKSNSVTDTLVTIYSEKAWHPNYLMQPIQDREEGGLYLNIWRPNNDKTDLPILVYIHGGSLTSGSSAYDDYNGEPMAKLDVIRINIQYRLGVFGYFAHPDLKQESLNETGHGTTGNYGLLDQIFALNWINQNAHNFGGDKNNITIAGESAGSSSVSALCSSPLAKGLFKRAIGESSSLVIKKAPHTYRKVEDAYKVSKSILEEFNCSSIDELRKVPAEKLVETQYSNSSMMLDGYALTKDPYDVYLNHENNEEALLNGYNAKEADAFVVPTFLTSPTNKNNILERLESYFNKEIAQKIFTLYKEKIEKDAFSAFNEIISVYWFIMPHHSWSNMALNNGEPVYRYILLKRTAIIALIILEKWRIVMAI